MSTNLHQDAIADRPLDRRDAKTLLLSALGGALEFYDFVMFAYFTKVLSTLFFPATMPDWLRLLETYGIFAVGYLARPLGGIVMAHFGDIIGRKRMFTLSVFLMAVPTLLMGLLPVYAQVGALAPVLLLLLRIVQGVAIGGEVPGAWVFVAEHVPPRRMGLACASLSAGLTVGILIGSLVAQGLNSHMSQADILDHGWRIPFLLGGAFGFFAVYLRRWLSETPVFMRMRERRELSPELPVKAVLKRYLPGVALSMLVTWVLTAAIVVVILMTPTIVQTAFKVPAPLAFTGASLAALGLTFGCIGGGLLVDAVGRGLAMLLGSACLGVATYALFLDLTTGGAHFLPLYTLAGFFAGISGIVPAVLVSAFPPNVRFSGISLSYNVAYAILAAMTPPLVGYMAKSLGGLAPAHYVGVVSVIGMLCGVYLLAARRRLAAQGNTSS